MGCMLSAALTMKSLSFDEFRTSCIPPVDIFNPTINPDCKFNFNFTCYQIFQFLFILFIVSDKRYMKWLTTLKMCVQVNEQCTREEVNALLEAKGL